MKIIAFVGMPASGKTEASNVARCMGIPVVTMGDVIRKEVAIRNADPSDGGKIANELREKEGMDAIAKRCIPLIQEKIYSGKSDIIVIDGVRGIDEVNYFREHLGDGFVLVSIAIDASIEERFKRVLKRKRSDDMDTIKELEKRDNLESGWGMTDAIDAADITISNSSDLKEFHETIRELFEEMGN
ncbi:MAG: flagellar hook-basal body complex protein FliE [Methanosarcinaceae archaeon]|nr:flagellar hook-basal body complex protein FliE [Methanosarcinaceae archaeon]